MLASQDVALLAGMPGLCYLGIGGYRNIRFVGVGTQKGVRGSHPGHHASLPPGFDWRFF